MDTNYIEPLTSGAIAGLVVIAIIAIPFLIYLAIWALAKNNLFFTLVEEGQAKAILVNDQFSHVVFSFRGHRFVKEDELPTNGTWGDRWEIVRRTRYEGERGRMFRNLFGGIRWIGVPPFKGVHRDRHTWTSLEQKDKRQATSDDHVEHAESSARDNQTELQLVTSEEYLDYVLLQQDIYALVMETVETKDLLPVNAILILPTRVVNPYKALFEVQHWLEAAENRVADRIRLLFGRYTFRELVNRGNSDDPSTRTISDEELGMVLRDIRQEYGVEIEGVGIRRIDPGSEEAERFVRASGEVFIARQNREADKLRGQGEAMRAQRYYTVVSKIPGGKEMLVAEAIRDSSLSVVTAGGNSVLPAVTVADVSNNGSRAQENES